MDSDSESQDSDDGRRFRFETTRKDGAAKLRKSKSPDYNRRRRRSKERYSQSRSNRSELNTKDSNHKNRDRQSSKDRKIRNKSTKLDKSYNDSRDFKHSNDSKERKHKNKSKEKHRKRSRDRSRERSRSSRTNTPEKKTRRDAKNQCEYFAASEKRKEVSEKESFKQGSEKLICTSLENTSRSHSSIAAEISDDVILQTLESFSNKKKTKSFFERIVNKKENEAEKLEYGPTLPPKLEKKMVNAKDKEIAEGIKKKLKADIEEHTKPASPSNFSKSEKLKKDLHETFEQSKDKLEEKDIFGPSLSPKMLRQNVVGPVLPKDFVISNTHYPGNEQKLSDKDSEDDEYFGPLPADHPAARDSLVQMQLEHRARLVQAKFSDKRSPEKNKREEWMVELPPAHAVALGLDSIRRTFRATEGPDMSDRSMWTDTPEDRLRRQKEKEENRFVPSEDSRKKSKKSKDKDVEKTDEQDKRESLLDMHLKSMKKKKKKMEKEAKEAGLPTRRPFDRDIDLQANRLDDAKKKRIFEKASHLNDRFTVGKM